MGAHVQRATVGFTIIEVMLFFAVTGALMLGVLGSASVGVNTQRYSDAVNSFNAVVQQEFTNVTNVVNAKTVQNMCTGMSDDELPRGTTDCSILGRLMTVDGSGAIVRQNIIGKDPGTTNQDDSELEVINSYMPRIDVQSQDKGQMNWGTSIEKGSPEVPSFVSILIVRSPRSGNVYSYVTHSASAVVTNDTGLRALISGLAAQSSPQNAREQYMCVDRSGWVLTPTRVITLAPYTSGPSGVSVSDAKGSVCN